MPAPHLAVDVEDSIGRWSLDVRLHVDGDATVSTFVQHLEPGVNVGEVGPGWEYYLDRLVAAQTGGDVGAIDFEADYYPAMSDYYRALFEERSR